MDLHTNILDVLTDDRLLFNLMAIHALVAVALIISIVIKHLLVRGSDRLAAVTGLQWLDGVSKEAIRRARSVLFWLTIGAMTLIVSGGVVYHVSGGDIRDDLTTWYSHLTRADLLYMVLALIELVALVIAAWAGIRWVRRLRHIVQAATIRWLDEHHGELQTPPAAEPSAEATTKEPHTRHVTLERWFFLLERYAILTLGLVTLYVAGVVVGLRHFTGPLVGFTLRVLAILGVAHLLVMACRTLSHALSTWGNRQLGAGQFRRYWERVTRLFPFGERCFEAAVYVSAASLIIRELDFIAVIADFGPRLVECIGIFFGTRVLIELLYVLINEAFGMYNEERAQDQKGQTLVPLLQSICQYTLYFGSGVIMLGVLGVDTRPILAGAGILGLAGGLGAQSLITDVVSGFFILFENQYLVGDYIKIGDSTGRVEAVGIRCTQIRDEQGRLHIIPNGQVKAVINYSKGYVYAEVDLKLPASTNVEEIYHALTEAGHRLRHSHREVLGETVIKGLVDLTPSDITVRAVTRVQPGTHQAMQNEYRRLLKEVFDEQATKRLAA
jgi:small-conductance mechanosensitive channel